jgi:hypothetical protein
MTEEIDWPMTLGTLALALFIGWVVTAMYRPPAQGRALQAWGQAAEVAHDRAAAPVLQP